MGMATIALTGQGGGKCAALADVLLAVPARVLARVQEAHHGALSHHLPDGGTGDAGRRIAQMTTTSPPKHDVALSVFFPATTSRTTSSASPARRWRCWTPWCATGRSSWSTTAPRTTPARSIDRLAKQDPRIRAVHHAVNGGYGAALKTGFKSATQALRVLHRRRRAVRRRRDRQAAGAPRRGRHHLRHPQAPAGQAHPQGQLRLLGMAGEARAQVPLRATWTARSSSSSGRYSTASSSSPPGR